jgi:hypothetical protein
MVVGHDISFDSIYDHPGTEARSSILPGKQIREKILEKGIAGKRKGGADTLSHYGTDVDHGRTHLFHGNDYGITPQGAPDITQRDKNGNKQEGQKVYNPDA